MKSSRSLSDAPTFLSEHFQPTDRLATVLVNKRRGDVIQRLATARELASPEFQAWLRYKNAGRYEVYVSMNALQEGAQGRTKCDVGVIRHVFLDFDNDGTAAMDRLLGRNDLPEPNALVNTSHGKWQVLWKVEDFSPEQAESLQRGLARQSGADIAATDCARVLRLPGFYNHKYAQRFLVQAESRSSEICRPGQFPQFAELGPLGPAFAGAKPMGGTGRGGITQSEKDWAYAHRALARGEAEELVVAAIASLRRHDKPDPLYYARLTVAKALHHMLAAGSERTASEIRDR